MVRCWGSSLKLIPAKFRLVSKQAFDLALSGIGQILLEQMESSPFQIHHKSFMKTDITNQKLFATPFQGEYDMVELALHCLISGDLHKVIMTKVCPYMKSELTMATLDVY